MADKLKIVVRNRLIAAGAVLLFALPVLADFALRGWTGVFRYFAADSFLYITVARNFADYGLFTIDQVNTTNGFHPLWQFMLAFLYTLGNLLALGEPAILTITLLTNVVFIAAAIWYVCRSYAIAQGRVPVSFLFLPLGFFGLIAVPFPTYFGPRGALWGFVNGMESSLSLLLYGLLLLLMVRSSFTERRPGSALLAGVLLAALFLTRLDNAFLAVAVCAVLGVRALIRRSPVLLCRGMLVALPVLIAFGGYVAVNLATTGMALPVSGMAKYTAPNLAKLAQIVKAFSESVPNRSWRLAQIILPALVAVAALVRYRRSWWKEKLDSMEAAFVATALFVLLLSLYYFLVVPLPAQGHWYFPISILFSSLFILHILHRSPAFAFLESRIVAVLIVLLTLTAFVHFYARSTAKGPGLFSTFVTATARDAIAHYGENQPRILSFDDGIVAYATGWPVMTGRGFMLDAESIGYFRRPDRSLLELAWQRGFDRITALVYFNALTLDPSSPSEAIRRELWKQLRIRRWELDLFEYEVDYLSPDGRFAIIRMNPRN